MSTRVAVFLWTVISAATAPVRAAVGQASHDSTYEAWLVQGTDNRVEMRWSGLSGHYIIIADTLGDPSDPPVWVQVHHLPIPPPPQGYRIASECARGDSLATGRLVAIVRATNTETYTEALHAWALNAKFRIVPVATRGIRCANPGWGTP